MPCGPIATAAEGRPKGDRKSTRLNSSHVKTSYAVFCLKTKKTCEDRLSEQIAINAWKVMSKILTTERAQAPYRSASGLRAVDEDAFFLLMIWLRPRSTLIPYTTLFR